MFLVHLALYFSLVCLFFWVTLVVQKDGCQNKNLTAHLKVLELLPRTGPASTLINGLGSLSRRLQLLGSPFFLTTLQASKKAMGCFRAEQVTWNLRASVICVVSLLKCSSTNLQQLKSWPAVYGHSSGD